MIISKKGTLFEMRVSKEYEGKTVDDIFRTIWKAPKKWIHSIRMAGEVKVNNQKANWNAPLKEGDLLHFPLFYEENYGVIPSFYHIEILYEDEHLLVANKPAGMDTHPNEEGQTGTLANAVAYHLQMNGELCKVQHIHRLDRDTTGAVLFAKNQLSGPLLDRMLSERKIKRTYWALADGLIGPKKGTINKPIGRDRHHALRRRVSPSGQDAVTHFRVLKKIPSERLSFIECTLDTGRTHQIRVHLSDMGHPLAGDKLYGGSSRFRRQALHARFLEFTHPLSGEFIHCEASFLDEPPIFENVIE
ncbi:RluA family pseudouridine synthase [Falsibacillus pallidus]|uniref:RluA family pseudouridine synthase n=1 Tax=Falsibacillus pallidus TaxID=493781 RepID=UPI003D995296